MKRIFSGVMLTLMLMCVSTLSAAIFSVNAGIVRVPGVRVGDWAKYDFTLNYTTTDPDPPIPPPPPWWVDIEYYKVEVLSIIETSIEFYIILHFKNGTETSSLMSTNVSSPTTGTHFFIAANLSAGDSLYHDPFSPVVNATLKRTYAGMEREVNYIQMQSNVSPAGYLGVNYAELYWDRASGILDELIQTIQFEKILGHYITHLSIHLVMKETNIWIPTHITIGVNATPKTLNPRSEGRWITVQIELPRDYKAKDVNFSTVMLNGTLTAEVKAEGNGSKLVVKFHKAKVMECIFASIQTKGRFIKVTLTITGKLNDGTTFQGSDTSRVVYSGMPWRMVITKVERLETYMERFCACASSWQL